MNKSESGQIIVILAVALVAILGITALAVDGSMIYAERREDQSTADSAALAAAQTASASPTCATARSAAINQAIAYASAQEGVALVNDTTSPNRVEATCNADNSKLTVKIVVTSNTPTTFAQMVSRDQLTTTVESTSQVTFGGGTFAGGNRLVALGNTCDANGGIYSLGGAKVDIIGGGVYSASCIKTDGSGYLLSSVGPILYKGKGATTFYVGSQIEYTGSNGIIFATKAPNYILIDPDVNISNFKDLDITYQLWSDFSPNSKLTPSSIWPTPTDQDFQTLTMQAMPVPTCPTTVRDPSLSAPATIYPGTYINGIKQGWGALTLEPGIYCINDGKNVDFTQATVKADGVQFYFKGSGSFFAGNGLTTLSLNKSSIYINNGNLTFDNSALPSSNSITMYIKQGNFLTQGGAVMDLASPPDTSNPGGIKGVLIYMDPANTGTFKILAGGWLGHKLSGTIYAPNALATFNGGTDTGATNVQLIAKRISVEQGGYLHMNTTDATFYSSGGAGSIELLK